MGFARFMSSAAGRAIRVIAGLILIAVGYFMTAGTLQIVLIVVGFVPLIAGLFNFCLFAPLFGGPFMGSKVAHG